VSYSQEVKKIRKSLRIVRKMHRERPELKKALDKAINKKIEELERGMRAKGNKVVIHKNLKEFEDAIVEEITIAVLEQFANQA